MREKDTGDRQNGLFLVLKAMGTREAEPARLEDRNVIDR